MNGATPRHERPPLTLHQKVLAQAVATILEPMLKEVDRKLDAINEKIDALLGQLEATEATLHQVERRRGAAAMKREEDT